MPNCFALTRKSAPQDGGVALTVIDDEMRVHFGAPLDSHNYYNYWYDVIGLGLACGKSLVQLIAIYNDCFMKTCDPFNYELCEIASWLEEHFFTDAWAEIGGRR